MSARWDEEHEGYGALKRENVKGENNNYPLIFLVGGMKSWNYK